MKHSFHSSSFAVALLLGTFTLVGCGGALNLPDSVASSQASGPPLQVSVHGGHAPVQGSHVYLLQPGTTGYGSQAVSILGSGTTSSPDGYNLASNVNDPHVPATAGFDGNEPQYVTTDANGAASLTGAYTCTVGQPVYMYAYGGNIGTTSSSTPVTDTYTVSQIVVTNRTTGTGGTATYTFTVAPAETLTAGQTVTISGLSTSSSGGRLGILNANQTVLATGLTSTTFSFTATDRYTNGGGGNIDNGTYSTNGEVGNASVSATYTTTTTTPATQNVNSVALATLGNCPASGNFSTGSGALAYVYMNEVSTVATAYTFQPFTLVTNNDAWHIGTSGTTQALLGIENAAATAAQLYAIQGNATQSTSDDGEGHLANSQTQSISVVGGTVVYTPNQGNGVVPQATIDTLANILADCVDSVPTTVGTPTAQCSALFAVATDNGETGGTQPTDTGTAAINIARFPAGNHSAGSGNVDATYVSDLFALQTGTVPYVPDLSNAPNDWTVVINYPYTAVSGSPGATNSQFRSAESIAIDQQGEVWVSAQTDGVIVRLSPLGVQNSATYSDGTGSYIYGYVSIDGNNNAWSGNANSTTGIEEFNSNGVLTNTYGSGYSTAYTVIATNSSNAYFFASDANANPYNTNSNSEMWEYSSSGTLLSSSTACNGNTVAYDYDCVSPSIFNAGDFVAHGAVDATGDLWLTSENSPYQIAKVTPTGTKVWVYSTNSQQPEFPSIDASGNGWIASQATPSVIYKFPSGYAQGNTPTSLTTASTGATLNSTFGSAVDGNGNIWFANRDGNYGAQSGTTAAGINTILVINGTGTTTPGTANTAISPSTNYVPEAQYPSTATSFTKMLDDSLNVAIDPSGNVWVTNYLGNSVVEVVGAAAPVVTPLSAAAGNNMLGTKP